MQPQTACTQGDSILAVLPIPAKYDAVFRPSRFYSRLGPHFEAKSNFLSSFSHRCSWKGSLLVRPWRLQSSVIRNSPVSLFLLSWPSMYSGGARRRLDCYYRFGSYLRVESSPCSPASDRICCRTGRSKRPSCRFLKSLQLALGTRTCQRERSFSFSQTSRSLCSDSAYSRSDASSHCSSSLQYWWSFAGFGQPWRAGSRHICRSG